jgi:uncharacterized damage-inducible protein DinB
MPTGLNAQAGGVNVRSKMAVQLSVEDLIEYTDWERGRWREFLRSRGDEVLKIGVGSNGDGRFQSVGDVVRHIFSAETRYIDRLSGRELTDTARVANDTVEALFEFGERSRSQLKEFVATFPAERWDEDVELKLMNSTIRATPRKIVVHVLMHEVRHWPQIATLLRLNGVVAEFRDFLFSPVMSGKRRREIPG